ncbi:helix-turn-helix domain-containing protein [Psychromicrobium xiongbiense]|uniref:helix-turn-helix domain-containing protein n=1 Tax=Psychromicrobium xiongbiense TaxID=3051184 RepID=UPI002557C445|nr:helix-turn-helix domain-containing protein [Psychromicrobium sp. YIM S02556]
MTHSRGHLNPGQPEVVFDRFELAATYSELVRHVWVARWDVPPGVVRTQYVLTYPTFNLVLTHGEAALYGLDPMLCRHALEGNSWCVGVLLRPAAGMLLTGTAASELVGRGERLATPPRLALLDEDSVQDRAVVSSVLQEWLAPLVPRLDEPAHMVNSACRIAEEDRELLRSADLASQMGVSVRTLERLTRHYLGVSPKWLIDCRRMQQAATALFDGSRDIELSALAAGLGYFDYPHFSRRYRQVMGETPEQTRQRAQARRRERDGSAPRLQAPN